MRTRYKTLSDYGVPEEEASRLIDYCKSNKLTVEERHLLLTISISAAPGIEIPIYDCITTGRGYRTMIKHGRSIPIKEDDFYAYKRKVLAEFYRAKCGER